METQYYTVIKMKVLDAVIESGRFLMGDDMEFAADLYGKLSGNLDPESQFMLHMELRAESENMRETLQSKGCSLEELTENCRLITREMFKLLNLEK
jgi:hypothetical protein